jgi:hypothetical protein
MLLVGTTVGIKKEWNATNSQQWIREEETTGATPATRKFIILRLRDVNWIRKKYLYFLKKN